MADNYRPIENYSAFDTKGTTRTNLVAQPNAYIGMCAIPQLKPGSENNDFLNACAYWEINCWCEVDTVVDSIYTSNSGYCHPKAANVYPISPQVVTSTYFGMVKTIGKISVQHDTENGSVTKC